MIYHQSAVAETQHYSILKTHQLLHTKNKTVPQPQNVVTVN